MPANFACLPEKLGGGLIGCLNSSGPGWPTEAGRAWPVCIEAPVYRGLERVMLQPL